MLPRLLSGILAAVFLPLGVAFTIVGATTMRTFVYVGLPFLVVGLVLGVVFLVLQRRESARRRRRRAGPRTMAGTVAKTVLLPPNMRLTQGGSIEVFYDPQEPSNFEPVSSVQRTLLAT